MTINTVPQSKFHLATINGATLDEVVEDTGFDQSEIIDTIEELVASGDMRVGDWTKDKFGKYQPVYIYGSGKDAPKPSTNVLVSRDWSVAALFGDSNVEPVNHYTNSMS